MAVVTIEGGRKPMAINNGQDWLKHSLLERLYLNHGIKRVNNLLFLDKLDREFLKKRYNYQPDYTDIKKVLVELIRDGLVKVSSYTVKCCQQVPHSPKDAIDHAEFLELAQEGYDSLHEHIFP